MNPNAELREQIDACRPGSDDLALPALADLAQAAECDRAVASELDRSQRFDRAVVSALHDIPVPTDLLGRLLAQAERSGSAVPGESVIGAVLAAGSDAAAVSPESASVPRQARSRRWLVSAAAIASLAAVLAIGLGFFLPRPPRDVSQNQLADAASKWYAEATQEVIGWQPYAANRPPHTALQARPARSRTMTTEFGPASVYDCSRLPVGRALLFVIKTPDHFAVDSLPYTAVQGATGGLEMAAWQSGGQLYVLVLNKEGLRLENLLRKPRAA